MIPTAIKGSTVPVFLTFQKRLVHNMQAIDCCSAVSRVAVRLCLTVLLLTCQPAMAAQRVLLIRGLMDYLPGISPMSSLQARLTSEGYDVYMITHLADAFYKSTYWDVVIGHS